MNPTSKIYVAGHNGMVGSAIWRKLQTMGFSNLIGKSSKQLNLKNQQAVANFFESEKPDYVFLAAAKVGGILANNTYRAEFIYDNIQIQNNVIHQSYIFGVKKLLFLGSSCIYPRDCPQPIKEEYLLSGELEKTNEPYSIAKIAGIKMWKIIICKWDNFISVMPTNLYGPNDNFDLETAHVLPALIRKIHLGKALENNDWDAIKADLNKNPFNGIDGKSSIDEIIKILNKNNFSFVANNSPFNVDPNSVKINLWGTGSPSREFLHVDDLARACIFIMKKLDINLPANKETSLINIGSGKITIRDLASKIKDIIQFEGF